MKEKKGNKLAIVKKTEISRKIKVLDLRTNYSLIFILFFLLIGSPLIINILTTFINDTESNISSKEFGEESFDKFSVWLSLSELNTFNPEKTEFNCLMRVPVFKRNLTTFEYFVTYTESYNFKFDISSSPYFDNFENYTGQIGAFIFVDSTYYPFEVYHFTLNFIGLETIFVTNKSDVSYKLFWHEAEFNLINIKESILSSNDTFSPSTTFTISFQVYRTFSARLETLLLPLISASFLGLIGFVDIRIVKYLTNESSNEKKNSLNKVLKFRHNSAKWMIAIGFAQVILRESFSLSMNEEMTFSIIVLILWFTFFLTSREGRGNFSEKLNLLTPFVSILVIGYHVFYLIGFSFLLDPEKTKLFSLLVFGGLSIISIILVYTYTWSLLKKQSGYA